MKQANIFAVAALTLSAIGSADALTLYQVGNSLTWDTRWQAVELHAAAAGEDLSVGYHIRFNSTLEDIWNDPERLDVSPSSYGTFDTALPGYGWDAVSLQLYDRGTTTLADDLEHFTLFSTLARGNPANSDTRFFVHTPWPTLSGWDVWDDPVNAASTQLTKHSAAYFDLFMSEVDDDFSGDVRQLPVGEMLAAIRDDIADGSAPAELTSIDLFYRDDVHLSGLGRFVTTTAMYALMYEDDPTGLAVPYDVDGGWTEEALPPAVVPYLQDLVWDVITNQPWTGVGPFHPGDFDSDGQVDQIDYQLWESNFGSTTALFADANDDGVVDSADYAIWRDGVALTASTAAPEPSAAVLTIIGAALANRRRSR